MVWSHCLGSYTSHGVRISEQMKRMKLPALYNGMNRGSSLAHPSHLLCSHCSCPQDGSLFPDNQIAFRQINTVFFLSSSDLPLPVTPRGPSLPFAICEWIA